MSPKSRMTYYLIKTTFLAQNWQTGYFWNQEDQEALDFQFEPTETTLKFWQLCASPFLDEKKFDFRIMICRSKGISAPTCSCPGQNFCIKRHPIPHLWSENDKIGIFQSNLSTVFFWLYVALWQKLWQPRSKVFWTKFIFDLQFALI